MGREKIGAAGHLKEGGGEDSDFPGGFWLLSLGSSKDSDFAGLWLRGEAGVILLILGKEGRVGRKANFCLRGELSGKTQWVSCFSFFFLFFFTDSLSFLLIYEHHLLI